MTAKVWTPEINPKVIYNQEISWISVEAEAVANTEAKANEAKAAADAKVKANEAKAAADAKAKANEGKTPKTPMNTTPKVSSVNSKTTSYGSKTKRNKNTTSNTTAVEETGNNDIIESPLLWSLVAEVIFFAIAITLITVFVLRKMKKIRREREREGEKEAEKQSQEPSLSEIEVFPPNNI